MNYRKPIISVLGHVDHGKTELLDTINKKHTNEHGNITQKVNVTDMPRDTIERYIDNKENIKIPGLIWVDTPGHGSFTHSRKKGSQFADLAVLVIDITSGLQPQTEEALNILKESQTPFIVALNKIDKLPRWNGSLCDINDKFESELKNSAYEIAGSLHNFGFDANLHTEVSDFSKTISLVPISALKDEGIGNLCEIIVGLSQEYLNTQISNNNKEINANILDIREEKGYGKIVDIILYSGEISVGDVVFINNHKGNFKTTVNKILKNNNGDINEKNKLSSADIGSVLLDSNSELTSSSTITSEPSEIDVSRQIDSITNECGIVVSTNSVDSLIPIIEEFQKNDYKVNSGSIGKITKYDVIEASTMNDEHNKCVVGFNVKPTNNALNFAQTEDVKLIYDSVIHNIVDEYNKYYKRIQNKNSISIENEILPCEIEILPDLIFNKGEPAIFGVKIARGVLKKNSEIRNKSDNRVVGKVKNIKHQNNDVDTVESGKKCSIEIEGCKFGRDISEDQELLVIPPEKVIDEIINRKNFNNDVNELSRDIKSTVYENKKI